MAQETAGIVHAAYAPHPSIQYARNVIAALEKRTGRTIAEWIVFVQQYGPPTEVERRDWLKREHGLGTNHAWWIAERAAGKGGDEDDDDAYLAKAPEYVDALYAGKRSALAPIHNRLVEIGLGLGPDVKVCPCQTFVPLYRNHVFAQIKPATLTRIDLGLALGDTPAGGRLIDTGGFAKKDRITHRIALTDPAEIDAEVERWLRTAYERDG